MRICQFRVLHINGDSWFRWDTIADFQNAVGWGLIAAILRPHTLNAMPTPVGVAFTSGIESLTSGHLGIGMQVAPILGLIYMVYFDANTPWPFM